MNTHKNIIKNLISSISNNIKHHDIHYIIGIDGYSCSGKTTLTKDLAKHFSFNYPVSVFHIDDFITPKNYRYNTGHEEWYEHFYLQWDASNIRDSLFKPLKNNELKLKLKYYNKDQDSIYEHISNLSPKSIIIIEGVFLQRIEWKEFFDYIIFIDCPREQRFERELIRSNHKDNISKTICKYKKRYWAAEDFYEKSYNPLKSSDLVIKNY